MRKAFTLIELLVVIAIIAILAAILFPVFAQAKAAAKHTQNLSNIKQLATTCMMYANDYDDTFVSQLYGDNNQTLEFPVLWQPYIKNWGILYDPFRTNSCDRISNTWGDGTDRCMGYGVNIGLTVWIGTTGMFQGYVYNSSLGGYVIPGKSMTSFEKPAEMVMVGTTADAPMYSLDYDWQVFNGSKAQYVYTKEPRNGGKWVHAFTDGHAKTVMYGAYKGAGYSYMQMPKSRVDAERMCSSLDALDYGGTSCGTRLDSLYANRQAY